MTMMKINLDILVRLLDSDEIERLTEIQHTLRLT